MGRPSSLARPHHVESSRTEKEAELSCSLWVWGSSSSTHSDAISRRRHASGDLTRSTVVPARGFSSPTPTARTTPRTPSSLSLTQGAAASGEGNAPSLPGTNTACRHDAGISFPAAASNWTGHTPLVTSPLRFTNRMMASRHSENNAQEGATLLTTPYTNIAKIIPSLPLETRWPTLSVCQYASFWLAEVTLKAGVPLVHSCFEPRPTDIFLASFPKSGTTWLKALVFATLKRSTHVPFDGDHSLCHCSPHDIVRFLEIEFNTRDEFEALPSPRVLATHLPYSLLPNCITGEHLGCRIVYICREPKDALVSYWLFMRKLATGVDFTIQEALELFCEGRCPGGPQWQHVLQYWEENVRRPDRVLFLRYEEMLLEPETHIKKLAKFMGCEFSEEEEVEGVVSAIVELCSLGKLKDMEVNRNGSTRLGIKNESYFRKGVVGDWSNHMTPEMAQRLDKVVEDALQGTGFTFASTA